MTPTWRRRSEVLWRRSGSRILLRSNDGEVVVLDGSAVEVWDLLEAPMTIGDLNGALGEGRESQRNEIAADLDWLLKDLDARSLIEAVHAT